MRRATATSSHSVARKVPPRADAGAKPMACSAPSTRSHLAASASRTGRGVAVVGDVELEDVGVGASLRAVRVVREQAPAGAGEHHLRPFSLGQLGHAEGQGVLGEHTGDEDPLAVEQSHGSLRSIGCRSDVTQVATLGRRAHRNPRWNRSCRSSAWRPAWPSVGFDVVIGSRSRYRAMEVADRLLAAWPDRDLTIDAADNEGAADADVVVIATPWDAAASTAASVSKQLRGKVVISMANALAKVGNEFQPLVPPRGLGGRQRAGRPARVARWPPPSTTSRPRSWATSTTRSRATC